ncbi:hypothetical protein TIFTF001_030084 [Ficus carica]|uniref:RING-type E3 ubiquitin transferase n=1 Tax=Ficus carica TaxID=3494 RepID=A0AA88DSR6_FICCA|nr:hypothetical protein TIFTF001_030084 [Ficus carica]
MNNTTSSDDDGSPSLGGFRYGIGVSVGVLTFIVALTLLAYYCNRARLNSEAGQRLRTPSVVMITVDDGPVSSGEFRGLNDDVLGRFPKLLYAQAKLHMRDENQSAFSSCSICLADYGDSDELRLLPDCGHFFHVDCVDSWLRQQPTCPICRSSPIPTPLTTPLAEVAPLATATTT